MPTGFLAAARRPDREPADGRRLSVCIFCLLLVLGLGPVALAADGLFHHDVSATIDPPNHGITVSDVVTVPAAALRTASGAAVPRLGFLLHGRLEVKSGDPRYHLEVVSTAPDVERFGINGGGGGVPLKEYSIEPAAGDWPETVTLRLEYSGKIHHPLVASEREYSRSFSTTAGTIDEQGVVLSGGSWWLPFFSERLITYSLTVTAPREWRTVSQGDRKESQAVDGGWRDRWQCDDPMEEIYLIAARFTEYSRPAGSVTAQAFLRAPDESLASKYLEVTAQYIEMYRGLIGPYPFGKFALVENFWETGYGMPSFTLLGPQVIRLPFILHSSYPHEILHNWWGNSVYVDYETGNWCEGLTAYLADHLIKEGQGRGVEYRRDVLKKYRSYVGSGADFPLTEFRSRHDAATEAVGYGKSLMLWHMLRRKLGDEKFAAGLRRFYRQYKFRRASFRDMAALFLEEAESNLRSSFFHQWVERTGAPEFAMEATTAPSGGGHRLELTLRQIQDGDPYELDVPAAVTLADGSVGLVSLSLSEPSKQYSFEFPEAVTRVDVDPYFDVFRRLHRAELPPTLGDLFGSERVTIVLPAEPRAGLGDGWRRFAESWAGDDSDAIHVVTDDAIRIWSSGDWPADRAIWFLGTSNHFAPQLEELSKQGFGKSIRGAGKYGFGAEKVAEEDHCFAAVMTHPRNPELAVGWIGADRADALPGLARKLPHYGKYSYVAFSGAEPTNVIKGQWPTTGSPLVATFPKTDGGIVERGTLPPRQALARLAPVFEPQRFMAHIGHLASDEMEGRGAATAGLEASRRYIAEAFESAGLTPGGDDGTFFQTWTEPVPPDAPKGPAAPKGDSVKLHNVIGVIPGTKAEWREQSVVIGAHYDHLGRGWPDVRSGQEGLVHNGADDNASGVAVLLEMTALLGEKLRPERTIIFVAFSGEEWGLKGSRHYVKTMSRWPAAKAMAMLNLDSVGRLEGRKIQVLGSGSATEWIHIARGIGFTTGVESVCVADDPGGSDQKSFHEAGVPAVQIFSGMHADYHRSTDDVDKIDSAGLVKVATFVKEALEYLAGRPDPLTSTLSTARAGTGERPSGSRRVSLGTIPDFEYTGDGVGISGVMPGSPAEKAGLAKGDVLLAINDVEMKGLRAFSTFLRQCKAGDTISIRFRRGDEERMVEATLVAR